MALLEIKNATISYGTREIVKDFNLTMEEGQVCSIVGESGSGKTTVIRAVLGLLARGGKVTKGEILFNGQSLLSKTADEWRELRGTEISMIFQDSGAMMNPTRKIGSSYVEYIQTHEKGLSKKDAWDKAVAMLERMRLPSGDNIMKSYPFQLSGGMRQRAALLRTYMFSKDVALLDEPFSALDTFTKSQMHSWYLDVMEKIQLTTLFVTHDIDESILLSDRIYLLTGRPGVIEDEIIIDEPRPRGEEFLLSQIFLDHKKKILSIL